MRLIDADELMEHVWRDKLDSRELIAKMIDNALTIKEIPTKIPLNIFEQLISQQPKIGKWVDSKDWKEKHYDFINFRKHCSLCNGTGNAHDKFCPNCGAKMTENEDKEQQKVGKWIDEEWHVLD